MALFVKMAGDIPTLQQIFIRNTVSMIITLRFVDYYKERFFVKREIQKYLLLHSSLEDLGFILNLLDIDHLVLANEDMLNKMSHFVTIIFAAIFLREYVLRYQITSIVIAFLGTLFIIKPSFDLDMVPYLAGIASAVFAGGAYTVLRLLGNREQ